MKTFVTTLWQENYMKKHSGEYTCRLLARKLGLEMGDVFNYCARHNLPLIKERTAKDVPVEVQLPKYRSGYVPDAPKKAIKRPPAVYTNKTPYGIANHH